MVVDFLSLWASPSAYVCIAAVHRVSRLCVSSHESTFILSRRVNSTPWRIVQSTRLFGVLTE